MQNAFENVLAFLDDQYRPINDIDRLINAVAEKLDYPTKVMAEFDSRATVTEARI